ncbi:GPO family capsid scaffolding protein [Psychrobacter alimentarius]|uniref:GPO family capsid scaffolding protein n=1 Tax=Psychrobacter alimentarius TaxID=261164 RepID=UPI003FD196F1
MSDTALPGKRVVKRFRVAREGQTVDGRSLSQQQIIDMSETYDPVEYTARINCEHMSGWWEGLKSERKTSGLGDVIAVSHGMETFTKNGVEVQLMCLYATLSALPDLVEANQQGAKIFSSIEFYPKFADTDRAYLVGLAVTDTPASLGTEPLKFNRNSDALRTVYEQEITLMTTGQKKPSADNTTTEDQPTPQNDNTQDLNKQAEGDGFLQKLSTMFASKKSGMSVQEQDLVLQSFKTLNEKTDDVAKENEGLQKELSELKADFEEFKTQLSTQPATNLTNTPPITGGGAQLTEY